MKAGIGELLAAAQAQKGVTDTEAARMIGVSQPTITRWRLGRSLPNDDVVPKLAKFIGVADREVHKAIQHTRPKNVVEADGTLGQLLRTLEAERGIEAADAWPKYGFDKSTYYRWRQDKSTPRLSELPDIAAALGVREERLVLAVYRTEVARTAH